MKTIQKEESYQEIIKRYADSEEDFAISNKDAQHASFIIETLFNKADSEMCIFTGSLYNGVYGNSNLINEAILFLNRDPSAQLKIVYQSVVDKDNILNNEFIKKLLSGINHKNQLVIRDASDRFSSIPNHFCVVDKKAFRYELDHNTREATANFGDKETAIKLDGIFNVLFNNSKNIAIQN